jgi:hypothetical protein
MQPGWIICTILIVHFLTSKKISRLSRTYDLAGIGCQIALKSGLSAFRYKAYRLCLPIYKNDAELKKELGQIHDLLYQVLHNQQNKSE